MILSEREKALKDYVLKDKDTECVWGISDCSSWAARWVELITGRAPILPEYNTREQAHRLISQAGGLDKLWDDALHPIGIYQTHLPELGDVGICDTKRYGQIGLVFAHGGTAFWRAEKGLYMFSPRKVVKVWHVA